MLTPEQIDALRQAPDSPNRLKAARKLAGITQVQLASVLRLSQNVISTDEAGDYINIDLAKSRAYARIFGCTVDDLFPPSRQKVSA